MKRKILKLFILCVILIIPFTIMIGCGDFNSSFNFKLSNDNIDIYLDGELVSDENVNEATFTVSFSNRGKYDDVWYSIQNENIIAVNLVSSSDEKNVYKITALNTGNAQILFHDMADLKNIKTVNVNVYKHLDNIEYKYNNDVYVAVNSMYTLNANMLFETPEFSNKNEIRYKIIGENKGAVVNEKTGVIDARNVLKSSSIKLRAYCLYAEDKYVEFDVHFVKQILASDLTISSDGVSIYENGEYLTSGIELIKTDYNLAYKILNFEFGDDSLRNDNVQITLSQDNESVLELTKVSNALSVLSYAKNLGTSNVTFEFNILNAEEFITPLKVTLPFTVIDVPTTILCNGNIVKDEYNLTVYSSYEFGVLGAKLNLSVLPSSVAVQDSKLEIYFDNANASNDFTFLFDDGKITRKCEDNSLIINANEEFYIRTTSTDIETFVMRVKSLKAEEYEKNVSVKINLNVVQGITSLTAPEEFYIKANSSSQIDLLAYPEGASNSYITIKTSSDKISVTKNVEGSFTYNIHSSDAGTYYIYFERENGLTQVTKVVVFNEITNLSVEVDNPIVNSKIGEKYYEDGKLRTVYAEIGSTIDLKIDYNLDATIVNKTIVSDLPASVSISGNSFRVWNDKEANILVTLTGYSYTDGVVSESVFTAGFKVVGYRSISSFSLNKNYATLYDSSTIGAYNISNYSMTELIANVYPLNATYVTDIEWKVTTTSNQFTNTLTLSRLVGSSTYVTANNISANNEKAIVTATIKQFSKIYTQSCLVDINKAITVTKISLVNVAKQAGQDYGTLSFDSRKGLNNPNNTFQVKCSVEPYNALNTKLRYTYLDENKNYANSDFVYNVDSKGVVTPLKAGIAWLKISSEDGYKTAGESNVNTDIYVKIIVQDGKTEERAFEIATAEDLMNIGTDNYTMSLYYKLTNNIDMSSVKNFTPIGLTNNLVFTGQLSGQNDYEVEGVKYSNNYEIRNLSIKYSLDNNIVENYMTGNGGRQDIRTSIGVGLFSQMSSNLNFGNQDYAYEGAPRIATIKNLTINIKSFVLDCGNVSVMPGGQSFIVNAGGVAGSYVIDSTYNLDYENVDKNTIKNGIINTFVKYDEFRFLSGKCAVNLGGMVGTSNAVIVTNKKGNAVSGNTIKIVDKFKYLRQSSSGTETFYSVYNIGGLVGKNNGFIAGRYALDLGEDVVYNSVFGTSNIDVTMNMFNNYIDDGESELSNPYCESINGVVGGLVGLNIGYITNCATENNIYGRNNVGGLVGRNEGTIKNSFSSSLVRGFENVGGLVGYTSGKIENSFAHSYEDGVKIGDDTIQVKGENYVGGLVGLAESNSAEIINCYTASYMSRYFDMSGTEIASYRGNVVGVSFVGALIGDINAGTVEGCYSNYLAFGNGNFYGLIARAVNSYVSNCYADSKIKKLNEAYGNNDIIAVNNNSIIITSYVYDASINEFAIYDINGNISNVKTSELNASAFSDFDSTKWKFKDNYYNGKSPILVKYSGTNEYAMVEGKPSFISVDLNYKIDETTDTVMLFYYTEKNFNYLNTFDIDEFIFASVLPKSGYSARLEILSSDSEVVAVGDDGKITINGRGYCTLTIYSKLNRELTITIKIYVINAVMNFTLYDSSNTSIGASELDGEILKIKQDQNYLIKPNVTAIDTYYDYALKENVSTKYSEIESNLGIEYTIYDNDDEDKFYSHFTIESFLGQYDSLVRNGDNSYNLFTNYMAGHIINGIKYTDNRLYQIKVRPYVILYPTEGNEIYVYLDEYIERIKHFNQEKNIELTSSRSAIIQLCNKFNAVFNLGVYLGSTDFSFINSNQCNVNAGTEITISSYLTTDDINDSVSVLIIDQDSSIVSSYEFHGGNKVLTSDVFDILVDEVQDDIVGDVMKGKYYTLSCILKDEYKFINVEKTYIFTFTVDSNPGLSITFYAHFYPESVNRIDTAYFSYGELDVEKENTYNPKEFASNYIVSNYMGLLELDVYPYFASFDNIRVRSQNLAFTQYVKKDNVSGDIYPYETVSDRFYLTDGIVLSNLYYENGQILKGCNGKYYVGVLLTNGKKDEVYSIQISAVKGSGNSAEIIFTKTIYLTCAKIAEVHMDYDGETNDYGNELFAPAGTKTDINIVTQNYTGDVELVVTNVNNGGEYLFASVIKENTGYKLQLLSNAIVGDKFIVTAIINNGATASLTFIVVDYLIKDIGFENVKNNQMRQVFGGIYDLKITLENSVVIYDTNNLETKNKIIKIFNELSTANYTTFFAYHALNGKDVSFGKSYSNKYYSILLKSKKTNELYLSGNMFDRLDVDEKRISVSIKFHFDSSSNSWQFSRVISDEIDRSNMKYTELYSRKNIVGGKTYRLINRVFTVDLYLDTNQDNALPIYNLDDFYNMEDGLSYRLMRDLTITNFTPITAQIKYFDGNNKTLTLSYKKSSNLDSSNNSGQIVTGLFSEIGQDAIVENVKIVIDNQFYLDASNYSNVTFGMLAGINYGKIYNCSISFSGIQSSNLQTSVTAGGTTYTGDMDYINSIIDDDGTEKSGSYISANAKGIMVQISLELINNSYVSATMGALVGNNRGYITSCRVESGLALHGYGIFGGLVGSNDGVIASSYSKGQLFNYSTDKTVAQIGGLSGINSGRISLSFTEGSYDLQNAPSVNYEINGVVNVGGFVNVNTGTISNCYSNVKISSSASTAGFVYNNSGTITNTYSTSLVRENSKQDMAFVGIDEYENLLNTGSISNSYFLKGKYTYQDRQPVNMVSSVSDFADATTFASFGFNYDVEGNVDEDNATDGIWFIPRNDTYTSSDFYGQKFVKNKPTLVSANSISRGNRELLTVSTDGAMSYYEYTPIIGGTLGSADHPYVIYDAKDFNKFLLESTSSQNINNKYYVLACDISYTGDSLTSQSIRTIFSGKFEGNEMQILNVKLNGVNFVNNSMGYFEEIRSGNVKNVNLFVEEALGSSVKTVGSLAGKITNNSKIYGINVNSGVIVLGKNVVGGLAGFVENSVLSDVSSSSGANASYRERRLNIYIDKSRSDQTKNIDGNTYSIDNIAYAGGVAGIINGSYVKSVRVQGQSKSIGNIAGGIFGLVGTGTIVEYADLIVNENMYIKAISILGGICGENRGKINLSYADYAEIEYANDVKEEDKFNYNKTEYVGDINEYSKHINTSYFEVQVTINSSRENSTIIGGLIGFNNGGTISNSYSKLTINDVNCSIAGGIIGASLGGIIETVYSAGAIYISSSDTVTLNNQSSSYYKYTGGLVGLVANGVYSLFENGTYQKFNTTTEVSTVEISSVFNLLSESNVLYINSSISLSQYDSTRIKDYTINQVGGIIGGLANMKYVKEGDFKTEFNSLIYNSNKPDVLKVYPAIEFDKYLQKENENDVIDYTRPVKLNAISVINNGLDTSFSINSIREVGTNNIGTAEELLLMYNMGALIENEEFGTSYYEGEYLRDDNQSVDAIKNTIFMPFKLFNFVFKNVTDRYPIIRDIAKRSVDLSEIFNSTKQDTYQLNTANDVRNMAIILNNGLAPLNYRNITFELTDNIDYEERILLTIGTNKYPFCGIFNGNNHYIRNAKINLINDNIVKNNANAVGYIGVFGRTFNARINQLYADNIIYDINALGLNTVYTGLIGYATNTNIYESSIIVANIKTSSVNEGATFIFGGFMGLCDGSSTSSEIVIKSSFSRFSNNSTTIKICGFVGEAKCKISISTCYSILLDDKDVAFIGGKLNNTVNIFNSFTNKGLLLTNLKVSDLSNADYQGTNIIIDNVLQLSSGNQFIDRCKDSSFDKNSWINENIWVVAVGDLGSSTQPKEYYSVLRATKENLSNKKIEYPTFGTMENEKLTPYMGIGQYDQSTRTFTISTAEQLVNLAIKINSGEIEKGGEGYIFKLANDIKYELTQNDDGTYSMFGKELQPIGNFMNPFRGVFEGNGMTITGYRYKHLGSANEIICAGLFGRLYNAYIKNLYISEADITITNNNIAYMGILAGLSSNGKISNVIVQTKNDDKIVKLTINNKSANAYVGGLIGYTESQLISECASDVTFDFSTCIESNATLRIGGAIGYVDATNTIISGLGSKLDKFQRQSITNSSSVYNIGSTFGYLTTLEMYSNFSNIIYVYGASDYSMIGVGTLPTKSIKQSNSITDF